MCPEKCWCSDCRRKYDAQRYQEKKQEIIAQKAARRQAIREWMIQLKSEPCTDCGGSFHYAAMEWDHLESKEFNIGLIHRIGYSRARILEELAKCELVCANCHRVRTHNRLGVAQLG